MFTGSCGPTLVIIGIRHKNHEGLRLILGS